MRHKACRQYSDPARLTVLGANFLVLFFSVFFSSSLKAADITTAKLTQCLVQVTGDIAKGDFGKLSGAIKQTKAKQICLNSKGGSWTEGVRIAEFVMKNHIGTYVGKNKECYSACALIFVAGTRLSKTINVKRVGGYFPKNQLIFKGFTGKKSCLANRSMHVTSKIGFHGPYVSFEKREYSKEEVQVARVAALKAFAKFFNIIGGQKTCVGRHIPKRLLGLAMRTKKDNFFHIDTVDRAGWLGVELIGYKLPENIDNRAFFTLTTQKLAWEDDKSFVEKFNEFRVKYGQNISKGKPIHVSVKNEYALLIVDPNDAGSGGDGGPLIFIDFYYADKKINIFFHYDYPTGDMYKSSNYNRINPNSQSINAIRLVKRILDSRLNHLLTPPWYAYPAKTKLRDIAE